MNIRPKKLTDDEFVEHIRRQTSASRKIAGAMSALLTLLLSALLYFVPRYIYSFRDMAPDAFAYDRGFAFGVFIGATAAITFIFLIFHLIQSLTITFGPPFFRIHRLLLKYYDIAMQHRTNTEPNDA
jgi:hypothetical protein